MSALKWPKIVVNWEGRRVPVRVGGMAHVAVSRNGQCRVIWVGAGVVVGQVAAFAGIRRVVVIASAVAEGAVVGNGDMPPG